MTRPDPKPGGRRAASLRVRILLIVLVLGTIPPLLSGIWLTRSGTRTSRSLVISQVEEVLEETVPTIVSRWLSLRSSVLDLVEGPEVQGALGASGEGGRTLAPGSPPPPPSAAPAGVVAARLVDLEGTPVPPPPWPIPETPPTGAGPTLRTEFTVFHRSNGAPMGTMVAEIDPRALLPESALMPSGGVFGLFDAATGAPLLPRAFDRPLLSGDRFAWGGDEWIARRTVLEEPGLTVAVAVPLTPFTRPFEETAARATFLLLVVAVLGFTVAAMVTRRMTRSIRELANAAEAVAGGDLERRIEVRGRDEIGRASRAFNAMTESLRRTLTELSTRESLAAMGEFAASLAHEVRNPLTAIRIDLERVEEGISDDSPLRSPQARALREIGRLEGTVTRALAGIRGPMQPGRLDLRVPLQAAAESSVPAFQDAGAKLEMPELPEAVEVQGDAGALQQLFLNLMNNAAQAMGSGASARVNLTSSPQEVRVEIIDEGQGIPGASLERVFEPLYTTRPEGTGLGLTIARRIAIAHGGTLRLSPNPGGGTVARVTLPRPGRAARGDP